MTKYVMYRRLSIEDRSRRQHGFESQLWDIENFLSKQESYEVVGDFKEFVSGSADIKPELEKALTLCKETGAELIVAKLDRYSRRVSQLALLLESEITLRVALMPNASTFELHIYASLAQQEKEMIQDRIKRGLAVVKRESPEKLAKGKNSKWHQTFMKNKCEGKHSGNKIKFTTGEYTEKALAEVKNVIKIVGKENLTLITLAEKLEGLGVKTPSGKVTWTKGNLSSFLKRNNIDLSDKRRRVYEN